MENNEILMGSLTPGWNGNGHITKEITLCVTEDCNLACKYCYMTGKNHNKKMTFETAKKAVDYVLSDRENISNTGAVIWDFIGGEPFLEIELIDKISDYIKQQMFLLDHPWFNAYRFNFSSNGILYNTEKVQKYIMKNRGHIHIGLSVDGNKLKHDMQRIYPDGSGSYDDVVKNVPLWLKQFPNSSTKATFSRDDLPNLKDSIISLWNLGINMVSANVVFENVWQDGDDIIFENQLKELADYIMDNELWDNYSVRFFSPGIGKPINEEAKKKNFCGAGQMLAIDCDGNLYPCIRFLEFSLENRKGRRMGDIYFGINMDKLRAFKTLSLEMQSKQECIDCEVAEGCAWCTGCNYDNADTDTVYQRITFHCKMHKANVKANNYFWDKYSQVTGKKSPHEKYVEDRNNSNENSNKFLQFITSDQIIPHCRYENWSNMNNVMSGKIIKKGLEFSEKNNFTPIILGNEKDELMREKFIQFINSKSENIGDNSIVIYDNNIENLKRTDNCILLMNKENISNIQMFIKNLSLYHERINLVIQDIEKWNDNDFKTYENQLGSLTDLIVEKYEDYREIQLNVLTDRLNIRTMCNCDAGNESFALAPNGKIYICPAFYFDNPENNIGDLDSGINIKNEYLLDFEFAPICKECDAYHCNRCKFLNKKLTDEINTPSKNQCLISHIERNCTQKLQRLLINKGLISMDNTIKSITYLDPLEKIDK